VEASFLYKDGYAGGADMTLGIQVNEIKHVLLADRWHEVESQSFALDAYEFMDAGSGRRARGRPAHHISWLHVPGARWTDRRRSSLIHPRCAASTNDGLESVRPPPHRPR